MVNIHFVTDNEDKTHTHVVEKSIYYQFTIFLVQIGTTTLGR